MTSSTTPPTARIPADLEDEGLLNYKLAAAFLSLSRQTLAKRDSMGAALPSSGYPLGRFFMLGRTWSRAGG